jgi:muconolactone delta-isomerase
MSDLAHPSDPAGSSEFLVEFSVDIPDGTPRSEVDRRESAEAVAAATCEAGPSPARLEAAGRARGTRVLGLYRAGSQAELDALLAGLPLRDWMTITVDAARPPSNDPEAAGRGTSPTGLPDPAPAPGVPLGGHARPAARTSVRQPAAPGASCPCPAGPSRARDPRRLLPGASADWQDRPGRWHRPRRHPLHAGDRGR